MLEAAQVGIQQAGLRITMITCDKFQFGINKKLGLNMHVVRRCDAYISKATVR